MGENILELDMGIKIILECFHINIQVKRYIDVRCQAEEGFQNRRIS